MKEIDNTLGELESFRNIDNHKIVIDEMINYAIEGKNHTKKSEFENPFNFHLSDLNSFVIKDKIVHKKYTQSTSFNKNDYQYIESFIFYNSELVENKAPSPFDEKKILNVTDYFYEKIKIALGKDQTRSEEYKHYISATYNILDSFYHYELMHPNSHSNPWTDLFVLCSKGYFLMCEDKENLKDLIGDKKLSSIVGKNQDVHNNMGVLAKGALKSNRLSGFIMDERFSLQNILFDFLNENAKGFDSAYSSRIITKSLEKKGNRYSKQLVSLMLNSMKRTGLIGSTTKGYFMLTTDLDIHKSISYHKSIVDGLNSTIAVLKSKLKNQ